MCLQVPRFIQHNHEWCVWCWQLDCRELHELCDGRSEWSGRCFTPPPRFAFLLRTAFCSRAVLHVRVGGSQRISVVCKSCATWATHCWKCRAVTFSLLSLASFPSALFVLAPCSSAWL